MLFRSKAGEGALGIDIYLRICVLAVLLLLGTATPFHEIKRTYTNTVSYYVLEAISEEKLYQSSNVCGSPDSFFWRYLAR